MITLHDLELSGNCYKVRLMLALLGLPYAAQPVDLFGGANRTPEFLALNPLGQVPVLEDDGFVLRDSQAILVYLARRHGGVSWWPDDARTQGRIAAWLSTAANEVAHGPATLRVHRKFGRSIDVDRAQATAMRVMSLVDGELGRSPWLAGDAVTIADVAVYPYVALAPEGGIELDGYPNIRRWIADVRALPGYVGMPGL